MRSSRHNLLLASLTSFGITLLLIPILVWAVEYPAPGTPANVEGGWTKTDVGYAAWLRWDAGDPEYESTSDSAIKATAAGYRIRRTPAFTNGDAYRIVATTGGYGEEHSPLGPLNAGLTNLDLDVESDKTYTYEITAYDPWSDKESEGAGTVTVPIKPKEENCPTFKLYGAQDGDQLRFWWPETCAATQYKVEWQRDVWDTTGIFAKLDHAEKDSFLITDPKKTRTSFTVAPNVPYTSVKVTAQAKMEEAQEDEEFVTLASDQLSFHLKKFKPIQKVPYSTHRVEERHDGQGELIGSEVVDDESGWKEPSACRPPESLTYESLYPKKDELLWIRSNDEPDPFGYSGRKYAAALQVFGWTNSRMTSTAVRLDYHHSYISEGSVPLKKPAKPAIPPYPEKPDGVALFSPQWNQMVEMWQNQVREMSEAYRKALIDWELKDNQRYADYANKAWGNGKLPYPTIEVERSSLIGPLAIINQCHNVLGTLEVKELEFKASLPSLVEIIGPWQLHQVKVTAEKVRAPKEGELEKEPPVNLREPVPKLQLEVTKTEGPIRYGTDLEALRVSAKEQGGNIDSPKQLTTDKDGNLTLYLLTATKEDAGLKLTHEVKQAIEYTSWEGSDGTTRVTRKTNPTPVILVSRVVEIPKRPPPVKLETVAPTGESTDESKDKAVSGAAGDVLAPQTKTVTLSIRSFDLDGRPDLAGGKATVEVRNNFGGPDPTLVGTGGQSLALAEGRGELELSPLSLTTLKLAVPDDVFNRTGTTDSAYTVTISRTMENGQTFTSEEVIPVATKDLPAPQLALSLPGNFTSTTPPTLGAGTTVPVTLRAFRPLGRSDGSVVEEPVAGLPVSVSASGYKLRTEDPGDVSTQTTAWHQVTGEDKEPVTIEGPDGAVWEVGDVTAQLLPGLADSLVTDEQGQVTLSLQLPTDLPTTVEPPVYTLKATVSDESTGQKKETTTELPVAVALRTFQVSTAVDQTIPGQSGDVTVTVSELGTDGTVVRPVAEASVAVSTRLPKDRLGLFGQVAPTVSGAMVLGMAEADPKDEVATQDQKTARQLALTTDVAGQLRIPVSQLQALRFPGLPLELAIAVSKPSFAALTLTGEEIVSARLNTRTQPVYHARTDGDLVSEFDVHFTLTTAYGDPIDWYFEQVMETKKTGEDIIEEELYKTFEWLKGGATYDSIDTITNESRISNTPVVTEAGLGKVRFKRVDTSAEAQSVDLVAILRLPFLLGYGDFLLAPQSVTLPPVAAGAASTEETAEGEAGSTSEDQAAEGESSAESETKGSTGESAEATESTASEEKAQPTAEPAPSSESSPTDATTPSEATSSTQP